MIGIELRNGTEALDRVADFPARLNRRVSAVMAALGDSLEDRVRDRLGGAVLQQRSGRLASAIEANVETAADGAAVSVGAPGVPYAAFQEFGFHGSETVRGHLRLIKEAFGRAITPRTVAVGTYSRRVDYPAHSYLRAALADTAPDAVARLDQAAADESGA